MNRYTDTNVWNDARSYLPDPYANLAEIERIEKVALHLRRLARRVTWERRVKAFCIAAAVFAVVYFGLRLLVGAVQ